MEVWQLLISSGVIGIFLGGAMTGINEWLKWRRDRKAKKEDKAEAKAEQAVHDEATWKKGIEDKMDNFMFALQIFMQDRISYVGKCYLRDRSVDYDDRRRLHKMHEAYKSLGGNGDLNELIAEVNELPLRIKGKDVHENERVEEVSA